MKKNELKASILLTLAAVIWGFAFVAQRVGAQYTGSFTYNGIRFALGSFSLLPLMLIQRKKQNKSKGQGIWIENSAGDNSLLKAGILAGFLLFAAAGLQQIGLKDTSAGKAAFITGFYIILVPAFGIFLGHRTGIRIWAAAIIAIAGLYLISVEENFTISRGDFLVFLCSFFFSAHILLINQYSQRLDTLKLSFVQYMTCSVLSLITALFVEEISLTDILNAAIPIIYGGVFSVGIAYTLQVVGQRHARASHAAIIMSLESVFALAGGIIILNETMNWKGYTGCILMLSGVLISQLGGRKAINVLSQTKRYMNTKHV
ncbi:MAG: DMT family transporter [Caldicoprobacterales bacterium]|jgi:drug/metabolite transporter (DMT)-like permease